MGFVNYPLDSGREPSGPFILMNLPGPHLRKVTIDEDSLLLLKERNLRDARN